jgi:hypothetical protein
VEHTPEEFENRLQTFVAGVTKKINDHYTTNFTNLTAPKVVIMRGSKNIKIALEETNGSKSVYCFIETTTGDVLKAASWKAPAKIARSNIFDEGNGLNGVNQYGAIYLR